MPLHLIGAGSTPKPASVQPIVAQPRSPDPPGAYSITGFLSRYLPNYGRGHFGSAGQTNAAAAPLAQLPEYSLAPHNMFLRGPGYETGEAVRDRIHWGDLPLNGTPPHIWTARVFNPAIKGYKGKANSGGTNNGDSVYLPRIVKFVPRRNVTKNPLRMLRSTSVTVQSTSPIRSVFVPAQELR